MTEPAHVIKTAKPLIEYRMAPAGPLYTMSPASGLYDRWASCISEGWCPLMYAGREHRLFPCDHAGEAWLVCEAGAYFRLVYRD